MTIRHPTSVPSVGRGIDAVPVSFLITADNKAAYLPAVLESVWWESRATGGEIILINDGSTERSDRICTGFAKTHPEIRYWRQENPGTCSAINHIAAEAQGSWIRFCDSADPLIPGSTRCLIEAAERMGAGVVYGDAIQYGPEPLPTNTVTIVCDEPSVAQQHSDALMHLICGADFTPSMAIYRRAAIEPALPLPGDLVGQDMTLLFQAIRHMPLARIDVPVCFSLHAAFNQLSSDDAFAIQQTIRITRRNADLLSPEHKHAAVLNAANRTSRWLREVQPERNSLTAQLWLAGMAILARFRLADFPSTLEKIAAFYEPDHQPLPDPQPKPL